MDAQQQPIGGKLAEVAPDRVLRQAERRAHVFGDHLPVALEEFENVTFALIGEHRKAICPIGLHARSRLFMIPHDIARSRTTSYGANGICEKELSHVTHRPMMILVAGPYRSGTGDDPGRMAENLGRFEAVTLPLFRAGHLR